MCLRKEIPKAAGRYCSKFLPGFRNQNQLSYSTLCSSLSSIPRCFGMECRNDRDIRRRHQHTTRIPKYGRAFREESFVCVCADKPRECAKKGMIV